MHPRKDITGPEQSSRRLFALPGYDGACHPTFLDVEHGVHRFPLRLDNVFWPKMHNCPSQAILGQKTRGIKSPHSDWDHIGTDNIGTVVSEFRHYPLEHTNWNTPIDTSRNTVIASRQRLTDTPPNPSRPGNSLVSDRYCRRNRLQLRSLTKTRVSS